LHRNSAVSRRKTGNIEAGATGAKWKKRLAPLLTLPLLKEEEGMCTTATQQDKDLFDQKNKKVLFAAGSGAETKPK